MLSQLVRYAPVLALTRELPPGTFLDVGSGSVGIAPWLPDGWTVTAVDASFDDYGSASGPANDGVARIVGDARALPFDDRVFDVVLALDILEHIAPDDRTTVLAEIARVARRRAIIGCPAGAPALEADRRLAEHYAQRNRPAPGWLAEHLEHGFPEPAEIKSGLVSHGHVRLLGNEHVGAHKGLMRAEAHPINVRITQVLNKALAWGVRRGGVTVTIADTALRALRGFDRPPTYRTIAVVDR